MACTGHPRLLLIGIFGVSDAICREFHHLPSVPSVVDSSSLLFVESLPRTQENDGAFLADSKPPHKPPGKLRDAIGTAISTGSSIISASKGDKMLEDEASSQTEILITNRLTISVVDINVVVTGISCPSQMMSRPHSVSL